MSLVKSPEMTEVQLSARRANARRSTGPRTARGKDRSRWNALQHGGYATHAAWSVEALQALGEDPEEFHRLRARLKPAEGPADEPLWELQLDDLARLYWRRRRLEGAWEILARHHHASGEPSELFALSGDGVQLVKQLDAVDRSIDRKARLLLRLREAEERRLREIERSTRRRIRQELEQDSATAPSDEEIVQKEMEVVRLRRHALRRESQEDPLTVDLDDELQIQNPAERTEEIVENKGPTANETQERRDLGSF